MTHVHEDIGAYVLGALDAENVKRVEAHLAECAECAAAHAELAGLPALLDLAVVTGATDEEPLPPAIEERILDRFAREHSPEPKQRRRWRPRIAIAIPSALVGAAAAAAALVLGFGFERAPERPANQYRLVLQPISAAAQNGSARAGLRTTAEGTVVRLWVYDLPGGPQDIYEVFCDAKGWSASAGTFRVDAQGNGYVILTSAVKRGQYEALRIVRRAHYAGGDVRDIDILRAKIS
ncbi:zf-HC2 domain-containing protein [Solirubrobacter sp. CPCC 204708]|uniref:Zf-HC2 domain-containing protein n=1 Tax=Solirubrobacter deserti TaxID=2282478 RepID=A0ABT4RGX6_9ACTN|nr:zf-HC2 domain-containing protein [Solirubrobacter deserti]MBE2315362.1 zf-HC2 domain-containing protein [Solirubrobacter deserti]MDA0137793.1 zf-HC2 domain-containing protein [Solirubrobacter deserti]